MSDFVYSDVDMQLLLELRSAVILDKPLPVSLLRVLAARGWVHAPRHVINVRGAPEGEPDVTISAYSQQLAMPSLTRSGENEVQVSARFFEDDLVMELTAEELHDAWEDSDDDEDDDEDEDEDDDY